MSCNDVGYPSGPWRKLIAATTKPLAASTWSRGSQSARSPLHHAPPCKSITIGNGPSPLGLYSFAMYGVLPWRMYSTDSVVNAYGIDTLPSERRSPAARSHLAGLSRLKTLIAQGAYAL